MPCPTPCDACKPGDLPILFTRYAAAFSNDEKRQAALAKLRPGGSFQAPTVQIKTSSYHLRMLRRGVLYVLEERSGLRRWRAFTVHPHGYLSEFDPLLTPIPELPASPACELALRGSNKSLVWIAAPHQVPNLWYFFHPDPVLPDILRQLKGDPGHLHHLAPSAWVDACPNTPHTGDHSVLETQVAEWAALDDPTLACALDEQIYGLMGIERSEREHDHAGAQPLYVNQAGHTSTTPPKADIFSDANPSGSWRKLDRTAGLPTYAQAHGARLRNIAKALHPDGTNPRRLPGLVAACDDAIGITQELNHWRNMAWKELITWGDEVESSPAGNAQSRKTRFEVAHHWEQLAQQFKQKRVTWATHTQDHFIDQADRGGKGPLIRSELPPEQAALLRPAPYSFADRAEYDAYMANLERHRASDAQKGEQDATKLWDTRYGKAIDLGAMQRCREAYVEKAQDVEKLASRRAPDHLAWVLAQSLQDTLALYNGQGRDDTAQGARIGAQIAGMLEGMNGGGDASEQQLAQWVKDFKDNPKNLLWRGYLMNQEAAQSSFESAMLAAQAPGKSPNELAQSFKNILDKFAKFNDLVADKSARHIAIAQAIPLFGMSPIVNNLLHLGFKAASGRLGLENKLARALMASQIAGTGSAGAFDLFVQMQSHITRLKPDDLVKRKGHTLSAERARLSKAAAATVDRVIKDGGKGEFFKLRVGGALTFAEALLFWTKAHELKDAQGDEARWRVGMEIAAASLTMTAAALEMGALMQEWVGTRSSSIPAKLVAEIRLGGFKLAGNALAGVAGCVAAAYDLKDAGKASEEDKIALMWVLRIRGTLNILTMGTGIAVGLSYCEHLFRQLAIRQGGSLALETAADVAAKLAARRFILFAASWWLTVGTISVSFVIGMCSDDEMEKWVKKSSFRNTNQDPSAKSDPLYAKEGEELTQLMNAFVAVN